jgi:hypothetical protein
MIIIIIIIDEQASSLIYSIKVAIAITTIIKITLIFTL